MLFGRCSFRRRRRGLPQQARSAWSSSLGSTSRCRSLRRRRWLSGGWWSKPVSRSWQSSSRMRAPRLQCLSRRTLRHERYRSFPGAPPRRCSPRQPSRTMTPSPSPYRRRNGVIRRSTRLRRNGGRVTGRLRPRRAADRFRRPRINATRSCTAVTLPCATPLTVSLMRSTIPALPRQVPGRCPAARMGMTRCQLLRRLQRLPTSASALRSSSARTLGKNSCSSSST